MHIMLDLETWGLIPGSDIRSIGAVVFDPFSDNISDFADGMPGANSQFYAATNNPLVTLDDYAKPIHKYPLSRDPETEKWWNDQSEEAQAAFTDPVDLWAACYEFRYWVWSVSGSSEQFENWTPDEGIRLWCKGPHFDISILAAIYRAVNLPVPWHYRSPRDMRTVVDLAGITKAEERAMFDGIPHHALDDAISQAKIVCEAFKRWMHNGEKA